MAQQPEDNFTMDLLAAVAPAKRGRGRPRKENALSDAERARSYRARKREMLARVDAQVDQVKRLKAMGLTHIYVDPMTNQTWTGRGLAPKWMLMHLSAGRNKSMFRVALG